MASSIKIPPRPKAVLVITPYYADHGGSTERIAGRLIADMASNTQPDAASLHFTWAASKCASGLKTKIAMPVEGKNLLMLPMRTLNQLEQFFSLRWPIWTRRSLRQLYRAVEGVDCLWLHDTFSLGSWLAFRMAKKQHKPILITKHSGLTKHPGFLQRAWATGIDWLITRKMLRQVQQTVFSGDASAEYYYRRVGFTSPVKIIPNGVDFSVFHPPLREMRRVLRARFALRREQPVLLFVGRFTAENGLPVLRELAKLLPDWRFWLAGEGPLNPEKWFLPNLQVFRGRRDADLAELYQSADLLLMPGYKPGFPLAAQEAMACGLPVMCGPAISEGSDFAKPYLWVVNVDAASPKQTASVWASKLKIGRSLLPLTEAKTELSDFAAACWEWPKIAGYYAEALRDLCQRSA